MCHCTPLEAKEPKKSQAQLSPFAPILKLRLDLVPIVSVGGTEEIRLEVANDTLINRTFFAAREFVACA